MRLRYPPPLVVVALIAGGCGGGDDGGRPAAPAPPPSAAQTPRADAAVIRAWSDTLSRGRPGEATRFFAVPATAANGTPPIVLDTRALVRDFNASLPCGARLLRTTRRGQYTVATFRLTERPGGNCGPGAGGTAATAFRIRDGRIVEWLRVPVPPPDPRRPEPPPEPREDQDPSETV